MKLSASFPEFARDKLNEDLKNSSASSGRQRPSSLYIQTSARLLGLLLLLLTCTGVVGAQDPPTPTLTSDKEDYKPGETATLTGSGFQAGETVRLLVLHVHPHEGEPLGEDHEPWYVTADEYGGFVTTWHVCEDDCVGEELIATADGQTSGSHAEAYFTDAIITITTNTLWSAITGGGGPGGQPVGNVGMVLGDVIIVRNGATVTVDVSTAVCRSIRIGNNNSTTLQPAGNGILNFNSGAQLIVSEGVTLGDADKTGTINLISGATLRVGNGTTGISSGSTSNQSTLNVSGGSLQIFGPLNMNDFTTTSITGGTITADLGGVIGGASHVVQFTAGATLTFTGGTLTIVDPNPSTGGGNALNLLAGAGTKNLAGSTIQFGDGTSTTSGSTEGFDLNAGVTLGNIIINNPSGTNRFVRLVTSNANIGGNLTITAGELRANGLNIILFGNWANSGTFTPGTGTVFMQGGFPQTMSGTAFNNLTIQNSSGVTLLSDETVNGVLTLSDGKVTTGTNKMIISATGSVSRLSFTSYIVGNLQMDFGTGDLAARVFDIGTALVYSPLTLDIDGTGGTAGTITATAVGSAHPDIANSGLDPTRDVDRYWTLTPGTAALGTRTYKLKLQVYPSDIPGTANFNNFEIRRYDGTAWNTPTGGTYTRAVATFATIEYSNFTAFSDFVCGVPCSQPTVSAGNVCESISSITFTQTGGAAGGTWSVSGGGTINPSTGAFNPSTPGCFTATYATSATCSDTKSFVVFPDAPTITAPSNTCNAAFTLPTVTPVAGFNVLYKIGSGPYTASPTIPTTPGCYTVRARYALAAACGSTPAGAEGMGQCGQSSEVGVVIFPAAPSAPVVPNTCDNALTIPALTAVSDFTAQYSFDDGGTWSTSRVSASTPGCYTMRTRYVLTSTCGGTPALSTGPAGCEQSPAGTAVIFPAAPAAPVVPNACDNALTIPALTAVSGFTAQYSFDDGGTWSTTRTSASTTPGCYTMRTRYVLTLACGSTAALSSGPVACEQSASSTAVVFPDAPTITAPSNTCNAAFTLPTVTPVAGFNVLYKIGSGPYTASPTIPTTPGCHTVRARYALAAACGLIPAGAEGMGMCGQSNEVSVVIFPAAPPAPTVNSGCGLPIVVTPPTSVPGFNIQYSFNDGTNWGGNYPPTAENCSGYKIRTRYVLASTCGATATGAVSSDASCGQSPATTRVVDNTAPTIPTTFVSKTSLWPPNHKMVDIALSASDACGITSANVTVTSNEPINDLGDGNTDPDIAWTGGVQTNTSPYTVSGPVTAGTDGKFHIQLRAERSGVQALVTPDIGRIYTIVFTATDGCGNTSLQATNTVTVAHNITAPTTGSSYKIGTTVALAGTFWDIPGNRHTAKWQIDGTTVNGTVTAEPSGSKAGKVTGSYKPTAAGVYKLRMNVTDQRGITSYATTNGDNEAFLVAYDPNGGYTYGAGKFISPAGALTSNPNASGKVAFGFTSNYFKNATNPKGETAFEFKVADFEFSALNFDYLVISGAKAQYKGLGKIIVNGVEQSGYAFILTVIDGQLSGGGGVDKIRLKIYNKNTGAVIYDNQRDASDNADPIVAVADPKANGTDIVVVNISTTATTQTQRVGPEMTELAQVLTVQVQPNPTHGHFALHVTSGNDQESIILQVFDQLGRLMEKRPLAQGLTDRIGNNYLPGVYYLKVIQGQTQRDIKVLKLPN